MAIALDNGTGTRGFNTGQQFLTLSFTCTGADRILFVAIQYAPALTETIDDVDYDGVNMTLVDMIELADANTRLALYVLIAPNTGTHNIVVSFSGGTTYIAVNAIAFTGVNQTGQPEAENEVSTGSASTLANPVTTITDNAWVVIAGTGSATDLTAGTNTTATSANNPLMGYYGPKTPAGSVSLSVNGVSEELITIVAAFAPAAGGGGGTVIPVLMHLSRQRGA